MASTDDGSTPNAVSRASSSRHENPASRRMRVPADSNSAAFPELPLPRMASRRGDPPSVPAGMTESAGVARRSRQVLHFLQADGGDRSHHHLPHAISSPDGERARAQIDHHQPDLSP